MRSPSEAIAPSSMIDNLRWSAPRRGAPPAQVINWRRWRMTSIND
jgi:hypothetical protein